ncbi:histone methyltransferase set1 [Tulasnella sp. 417]|nr:histone methyltransferase set1 [Tulasnella sp. 417]
MAPSGSKGPRALPTGPLASVKAYREQPPLSSLAMSPQPLTPEVLADPFGSAPASDHEKSLTNGSSTSKVGGVGVAASAVVPSSVKVPMGSNLGGSSKNQWMADGQLLHPSSSTSPRHSTSASVSVVDGFGKTGSTSASGGIGSTNTHIPSATFQNAPLHPPPLLGPSLPPLPPLSASLSGLVQTRPAASSPSTSPPVPSAERPPSRSTTPTTHAAGPSTSASSSNSNGPLHWPGLPRENRSWRVVYDPLVEGSAGHSSTGASNGTAARPGSKDLVFLRDGRDDAARTEDGLLEVAMDQLRDPRKTKLESGRVRAPKKPRVSFYDLSYEWDGNSPFPEPSSAVPPRAILVTSISHLTSSTHIKRHFSHFGAIEDFHIQLDPATGTHLGICWVKFASGLAGQNGHSEVGSSSGEANGTLGNGGDDCPGVVAAQEAVRQAARDPIKGTGMNVGVGNEAHFVEVVLDPEGKEYKQAVKTELARRRARSAWSEPRLDAEAPPHKHTNGSRSNSAILPTNDTSHHALLPSDGRLFRAASEITQREKESEAKAGGKSEKTQRRRRAEVSDLPPNSQSGPSLLGKDATSPPESLLKQPHARINGFHNDESFASPSQSPESSGGRSSLQSQRKEDGTEIQTRRPHTPEMPADVSMAVTSPRQSDSNSEEEAQRSRVLKELMMNGNEFVRIKNSNLPRSLKFGEPELKRWFEDAGVAGSIDKILHDTQGWYISFTNPDAARRCRLVLERRPFLHHPIPLTVQSAPSTDVPTSPIYSKRPPSSVKIRAPSTSPTQATMGGSALKGVGTPLSSTMKTENGIADTSLASTDMQVENLHGDDSAPVDDLMNELAFPKLPPVPRSNDVSAVDPLASMAGMAEPSEPSAPVNGSEAVKKKGTTSSSKLKTKPKAPRKRTLKEEGTADGPPKKKARTSGKNSRSRPVTSTIDVDKDLMDVIAADGDVNDEFGLAVETPRLDSQRASHQHQDPVYDDDHDDEVLDLEAALIMGSEHAVKAGSSATRVEEDLDVDAELLKAIGGEEDPPTLVVADVSEMEIASNIPRESPSLDPQSSAELVSNGSSKRPRESSPPPPPAVPPETSEILSTGRVRKKTKTPYAMATEQLAELDALIPLPPPTKSRKRSGKGKNTAERDLAYHSSAKSKQGGHARPSKPKASKVIDSSTPLPQANDDGAVTATDESGPKESRLDRDTPSAAVSTPPAPRPMTFQKPQRPRIPTLEEATPASPPPLEIPDLIAQPTTGHQSFEKNVGNELLDPLALELAIDDEELFFLKIGLAARRGDHSIPYVRREVPPPPIEANKSQLRVHRTGASRSEGYYKIPEALKSTYLPQRNRAMVLDEPNAVQATAEAAGLVPAATAASASSRSNRINTRRLVQGMEQANKAMGDTQSTQLQFNQLRARKKQLIFARSPIHDWGLYAMEAIPQGEMVIEYVGEVIRAQVADKREKWYEKIGIGSSYLFRVDEDSVVDATKRGNLGRLINHSCTPNCTAKIIVVNSQKKIVIYAKTSIEPGEEITYDYHFPLEQEKVRLAAPPNKGYMLTTRVSVARSLASAGHLDAGVSSTNLTIDYAAIRISGARHIHSVFTYAIY